MRFAAAVVLLALPLLAAATQSCQGVGPNLVVNGDFEQPALGANSWNIFNPITGWTGVGAGIEVQYGVVYTAQSGNQVVELDSNGNYILRQDVPTVPGKQYVLSYWYVPRRTTCNLQVSVAGAITFTSGPLSQSNTWVQQSYTFTAASASTRLEFTDIGTSNSLGMLLDNVTLKECGCNCDEVTYTGDDCADSTKTAVTNGKCICTKFVGGSAPCASSNGARPCPGSR